MTTIILVVLLCLSANTVLDDQKAGYTSGKSYNWYAWFFTWEKLLLAGGCSESSNIKGAVSIVVQVVPSFLSFKFIFVVFIWLFVFHWPTLYWGAKCTNIYCICFPKQRENNGCTNLREFEIHMKGVHRVIWWTPYPYGRGSVLKFSRMWATLMPFI